MRNVNVILTAVLAACMLTVLTCSDDNPLRDDRSTSVGVNISLLKTSLVEQLSMVQLLVTTDDEIVHADTTGLNQGRFLFESFAVPVGDATFQVTATNEFGMVLYYGDTVVSIEPGGVNEVGLELLPSVPMVKLSPYYVTTPVGAVFTSRLELFNLSGFYRGIFRINFDPNALYLDQPPSTADAAWGGLSSTSRTSADTLIVTVTRSQLRDDIPAGVYSLVNLPFRPTDPGLTSLTLSVDSLFDIAGILPEYFLLFTDGQTVEITGAIPQDSIVTFGDASIEAEIRNQLANPSGSIYASTLSAIDTLILANQSVYDLSGLQYCLNLELLALPINQISDLTPLAGLVNLQVLNLSSNQISLLSSLSDLTNLRILKLSSNLIVDIQPLVDNSGLGDGDSLWLDDNALSSQALQQQVPALEERGVTVITGIDLTAPAAVSDLTVADVGASSVTLSWTAPGDDGLLGTASGYDLRYTTDSLDFTDWLTTTPVVGEPTPQPSGSTELLTVSGLMTGVTYYFALKSWDDAANWSERSNTVPVTLSSGAGLIPDPNLETMIRQELGKPEGEITTQDLLMLESLEDSLALPVSDLTGLEYCQNMTSLYLFTGQHQFGDLTPLAGLTQLTELGVGSPNISDLSPLADLGNLESLWLWGSGFTDLNAISDLIGLTYLYAGCNDLTDISAVANFVNLDLLVLWGNQIRNIGPIGELTELTSLELMETQVNSLSALSGLSSLQYLYIRGSQVSDLGSLANMSSLRFLYVEHSQLTSLSAISGLTGLMAISVKSNMVSEINPLAYMNELVWAYLDSNSISDLTPLVQNFGLGQNDEVWLDGNPLSSQAIEIQIPLLQARGVIVHWGSGGSPPRADDPRLREGQMPGRSWRPLPEPEF